MLPVNRGFIMKADYSKFARPHDWDNWFGTVCINDGTAESSIKVEIQTEEDVIPEASMQTLDFFLAHYAQYQEVLADAIMEYYDIRRAAWGNPPADDPVYPAVQDRAQLANMYTLRSVVIHDPDDGKKDSIGLLFDCTWDDEGIGIRMTGLHVDEIGIQGTQY